MSPPSVFVLTAFEAALSAFFTVLEPDIKEFYHQTVGTTFAHSLKENISDLEWVPPPEDSFGTRFAFKLIDTVDKTSWWLFLADVAAEGLFNWTSQLLHVTQCGDPKNPNAGTGNFFFGAVPTDGTPQALDFSFGKGNVFAPVSPSQINLPPGWSCIMAFQAQFHLWGSLIPVNCDSFIVNETTGVILDSDQKPLKDKTRNPTSVTFIKYQNPSQEHHLIRQVWSWTGGDEPEHEVFPIPAMTFGYMAMFPP
jgi:hypothetical protein